MSQVLVLQHAEPETPALIGDALADAGHRLRVIRSFAGERVPSQIGDAAALVVMGGPMGVYEQERFPFLERELRLIEDALRAERPVLGVCLGSQLLAHALGAKVEPGPVREIGWLTLEVTPEAAEDPLLAGAPRAFTGLVWHGDVFDLPAGAVSLARSEQTAHQAFRHGTNAWGLLCHLEVTEAVVRGMVEAFPHELADAGVDGAALVARAPAALRTLHAVARPAFAAFASRVR